MGWLDDIFWCFSARPESPKKPGGVRTGVKNRIQANQQEKKDRRARAAYAKKRREAAIANRKSQSMWSLGAESYVDENGHDVVMVRPARKNSKWAAMAKPRSGTRGRGAARASRTVSAPAHTGTRLHPEALANLEKNMVDGSKKEVMVNWLDKSQGGQSGSRENMFNHRTRHLLPENDENEKGGATTTTMPAIGEAGEDAKADGHGEPLGVL